MNWRERYKNRIVSAPEAVKHVKSGDRVVMGHACGESQTLVEALVARAPELENVEIVHMEVMGKAKYDQPGMEKSFRHNSLFLGGTVSKTIEKRREDYTPVFLSEVPRLFKQKILPVDVALIQVTPPDKNGYCSYGVSVDFTSTAAQCATIVIAQMNSNMPRTGGEKIHLDDMHYIVEKDEPILELKPSIISEVEALIGRNIAGLVPDGATIQLGIGAIPDALLHSLKGKKDLGIHTEMFSDGVVDLAEAGVITNKKKTINPGKFIATFLMGSRRLYDFIDNNPNVELLPCDYTNDPCIIGLHENMVCINSALQVDFMGQVNAETIGFRQFSGTGGQVDYTRGASRSLGGKAIIAMPSTASDGKISRIVHVLDQGAAVTTSRNDVHYVVTEYGIADLRGKSLRQRAQALISIAHPDFRAVLSHQAEGKDIH